MIWAGIGFTVASYATLLGAWIYYSAPHQGEGWSDPIYQVRTGRDTPAISVVFGALAIFTDFYIIAIPITAISSLNLSTKKKFGVSALFVTGLLSVLFNPSPMGILLLTLPTMSRACAFSVAGLSPRIENYRQTMVHGTPDPFWVSCPSYGLASVLYLYTSWSGSNADFGAVVLPRSISASSVLVFPSLSPC